MTRCKWCNQYRPEDHDARYLIEILENCNAPDGDGHIWYTVPLNEFNLSLTMRDLTRLSSKRRQQLMRVLGEFLDTPREQEAKLLRNLILEHEGQRYGW